MSRLRGAWLVAALEVRERARAWSFLLSTGLIAVLAFGAVAAATVLPDFFEDDPPVIAIVAAEVPASVPGLLEDGSLAIEATVRLVASAAEARTLLRDGAADAALYGGPTLAFRE